jgi:hypothetical protein
MSKDSWEEKAHSYFLGCIGFIVLIAIGIGSFNYWMRGIRRDEALRQFPGYPPAPPKIDLPPQLGPK